MEFIRISDSKLKIMLNGHDMAYYEIDADAISCEGAQTRRAVRRILEDAREASGFDAAHDRILVEMYPSLTDGCELYITKVTEEEAEAMMAHTEGEDREEKCTRCEKKSIPREEGKTPKLLYAFVCAEDLLCVCRQLAAVGFGGRSTAYAEGDRYYLLMTDPRRGKHTYLGARASCFVAEEYGKRAEVGQLSRLKEHAICLADGNAVSLLAPYAAERGLHGLNGEDDVFE